MNRHLPVQAAVAEVNPILRGWVNYFKVGNSSQAFNKVKYHVERKVRRFAAKKSSARDTAGSGGVAPSCTRRGVASETTASHTRTRKRAPAPECSSSRKAALRGYARGVSMVLVTGMSGTGKSTALVELARRGFRTVDTDEPGWSTWSERDGGYAQMSDVLVDLRVDDHAAPIDELRRLYGLHDRLFGRTPRGEVISARPAVAASARKL